ncbi:hypothetical protein DSM112329_01931 [Paraconexibacter sp. AEG42_29]|uniref:Uncharacterized protein n=2 Tax=Paraconexibacter sp. AEG42_29 TaxID=2997339 RepID=A0AAU7AU06_9ACTN
MSLLAVFVADRECNHLEGDVAVAVGPRGDRCDALIADWRWSVLLLAPPLAAFCVVAVLGRRPWIAWTAWLGATALALVPVAHLSTLRAYPLA